LKRLFNRKWQPFRLLSAFKPLSSFTFFQFHIRDFHFTRVKQQKKSIFVPIIMVKRSQWPSHRRETLRN
jgi:hypothetical protein